MSTDKNIKFYLAGPMSGIPQHNLPAFEEAAEDLRSRGYNIISPAELDGGRFKEIVRKDLTGEATDVAGGAIIDGQTWGDLLSRDVKLIADDVDGIIFLPNWQLSRGARMEAYIGLVCEREFKYWADGRLSSLKTSAVAWVVFNALKN